MRRCHALILLSAAYLIIVAYYFYSLVPDDISYLYGEWSRIKSGAQKSIINKIILTRGNTAIFMKGDDQIYIECPYVLAGHGDEIDCHCSRNNKTVTVKLKLYEKIKMKTESGDVYKKSGS